MKDRKKKANKHYYATVSRQQTTATTKQHVGGTTGLGRPPYPKNQGRHGDQRISDGKIDGIGATGHSHYPASQSNANDNTGQRLDGQINGNIASAVNDDTDRSDIGDSFGQPGFGGPRIDISGCRARATAWAATPRQMSVAAPSTRTTDQVIPPSGRRVALDAQTGGGG